MMYECFDGIGRGYKLANVFENISIHKLQPIKKNLVNTRFSPGCMQVEKKNSALTLSLLAPHRCIYSPYLTESIILHCPGKILIVNTVIISKIRKFYSYI